MKNIFVNAEVEIKLLSVEEALMAEMSTAPIDDDLGWGDLI